MSIQAERFGHGPSVVLVHGSVGGGQSTWREQRALADRWTLLVVERPGFGPGPPVDRVDFDVDAPLVADALGAGAHLVGHSYGGVVSLLAAARRPEAVRSLTVIEPPAFAVAAGNPAVDAFVADFTHLWANGPDDPAEFLAAFLGLVGSRQPPPEPLSPGLERGARLLMAERGPWEAAIPLDALASTTFPKLVVSGAHHDAFDAVCDVLEARLDAQRAAIPGAGHGAQRTGTPFNERLEAFLEMAEARQPPDET
jgi:pimeloyl-ACP methyl ester carboxylesterase